VSGAGVSQDPARDKLAKTPVTLSDLCVSPIHLYKHADRTLSIHLLEYTAFTA
jgi:hypothetical protein